jgi:hypothetical protein
MEREAADGGGGGWEAGCGEGELGEAEISETGEGRDVGGERDGVDCTW